METLAHPAMTSDGLERLDKRVGLAGTAVLASAGPVSAERAESSGLRRAVAALRQAAALGCEAAARFGPRA